MSNDPGIAVAMKATPRPRVTVAPAIPPVLPLPNHRDRVLAALQSLETLRRDLEALLSEDVTAEPAPCRPKWNGVARKLTYGGSTIADFARHDSPPARELLDALERAGWPPRLGGENFPAILKGSTAEEVKARVAAVVRTLQRKLAGGPLLINCGGDGLAITWQLSQISRG